MTASDHARALNEHYGAQDLLARIEAGLRAVGKEPTNLVPDDLAQVDQFHTGGKEATLELARLAGLRSGERVLDIGCGIGGPARTLAANVGCLVTGLDLTAAYCEAAEQLTRWTGLGERVSFRQGDALDPPFDDRGFDVVWTQHSTMNISDKERLYAEAARVVRPGGRLALHEIMAGEVEGLYWPVPWAREPALSFLRPPDAVRTLIAASGFRELAWQDRTADALAWFRQRSAALARQAEPPPLGLHLLLGPDFAQQLRNLVRALEEQRLTIVQAVFERV